MSTSADDRLLRLASVVEAANAPDPLREICRAATVVLGVSGTGLMLMNGGPPSPLAWSNGVSSRLEELQQTLGEGPCVDAHRCGRPVCEPELARPQSVRWAIFAAAALDAGVESLFSFPLRVGGVRLGALTVHRTVTGGLSHQQYADALAVASIVTATILATQAEAPPGALSRDLESLVVYNAALHQAAGMVSVQLGIGVGEALVRLRAHAYSSERPLAAIAADVVARRLRLDG